MLLNSLEIYEKHILPGILHALLRMCTTHWIQKFILESLAQSHEAVYIPKYKTETLQKVKKVSALFEQRHARQPKPEELADESLTKDLSDALTLLNEREKKVLLCAYGIGKKKKTQKEMAEELNVSLSRIWQIVCK